MAVEVTRRDLSAAELRREARSRDANAARRMLAIALVLEGHSRAAAAAPGRPDRNDGRIPMQQPATRASAILSGPAALVHRL
jgi:hypothetical protein